MAWILVMYAVSPWFLCNANKHAWYCLELKLREANYIPSAYCGVQVSG